jgi:hypothetical protein
VAKIALLIGVSEYEAGLASLPKAVEDANAMKQVLQHPEMGGFAETDITLLTNPVRQRMEEAIFYLFANRSKDDLLLFYFSGHGIKDDSGSLFLATRGTRKENGTLVRPTAAAARVLHDNMNGSRSKRQVVILDCCFSGAFAQGMTAKDDGRVDVKAQLGGEGRAILTSSTSTQYSFEQESSKLSIYTHYLVEGIGKGAADLDSDGWISVDELHEYASSKVQEAAPAMKPEFYPVKEGHRILLSKARIDDPRLKYRKEATKYASRGKIFPVGRMILDTLRSQLELTVDEASAIEKEVLQPYQERLDNLQRYRQAFGQAIEFEYPLSEETQNELKDLQRILGLRDEDIVPIQQEVTSKTLSETETYQKKLQEYERELLLAIEAEFPMSARVRQELKALQQTLELKDKDVASLEAQITRRRQQEYQTHLEQYEQEFARAIQAEYPLSDQRLEDLKQLQQRLGLKDKDVLSVETQIRSTKQQRYQSNLQRYEREFTQAVCSQFPIDQQAQQSLNSLKSSLGLSKAEVDKLEAQVIAQQQQEYQTKLQQYEQAFIKAVEAELPVGDRHQQALKTLQQNLGLKDADVNRIQTQITAQKQQEYQAKLQQYEQAFVKAIEAELPVGDRHQQALKSLQQNLGLKEQDVNTIQAQITAQKQQEYQAKLQQYEQAFVKAIEAELPVGDRHQQELRSLQQSLGLKRQDVDSIESRITAQKQQEYQAKLQEYTREFSKAIQETYPFGNWTQRRLTRLQKSLNLKEADILLIQQPLITQKEEELSRQREALNQKKSEEQQRKLEEKQRKHEELVRKKEELAQRKQEELNRRREEREPLQPAAILPAFMARKPYLLVGSGLLMVVLSAVGFNNYRSNQNQLNEAAMLEPIRALMDAGEHQECVTQAQTALEQESNLHPNLQDMLGSCQMAHAQQMAEGGSFKDAIAQAIDISPDHPHHEQAQQLVNQWSERILAIATEWYEEGKLDEAIAMTQAIPADIPMGQTSQEHVERWQTEWQANEAIVEAAQKALDEKRWQAALDEAAKLPDVPYWQEQVKSIVETATSELNRPAPTAAEPTPTIRPTVYRSPSGSNSGGSSTAGSSTAGSSTTVAPPPTPPVTPTPASPTQSPAYVIPESGGPTCVSSC